MSGRNVIAACAVLCLFMIAAGYSLLSARPTPVAMVLGSPGPHSKAKALPNLAMDLTFSRDGSQLVAWQKDGKIVVWDLASGKARQIGHSENVFAMCGGKDVLLRGMAGGVLGVQTLDGKVISQLELGEMEHAAWSEDCSKFVLAPKDKNLIELWDGAQLFQVASAATSMPVRNGLALSADGTHIAAALGSHSQATGHRTRIETYFTKAGSELARRSVYSAANSVLGMWKMVFAPRAPRLFVGSQIASKSGLRSFDVNTGSEDWHQSGFESYWVRALAVSPDGRQLVSGDEKGNLRLWDAATGKAIGSYKTGLVVQSVAFSRDGSKLAMALWDGTIGIVDVQGRLGAGS